MKLPRSFLYYKYLPAYGSTNSKYFSSSSSSKQSTHYDVLGIDKKSSRKEIRAAFLAKSKEFHPDSSVRSNLNEEQLKTKFQAVNEAYQVLNDPTEKRVYDESLQYSKAGYSNPTWRQRSHGSYSDYQQYRAHQEYMRQQHHFWSNYHQEQQGDWQEFSWRNFFSWRIGKPVTVLHFMVFLVICGISLEIVHSITIVNYVKQRKQESVIYGPDWFNSHPFDEAKADEALNELLLKQKQSIEDYKKASR